MKIFLNIIKNWLPVAAASTLICLVLVISVQQNIRLSANDPQIQMAEDAAYNLAAGATAETMIPPWKIDISRSLSPFLMIYDKDGALLGSSAAILGQTPEVPAGVLKQALTGGGENTVTWQLNDSLRYAIVVTSIPSEEGGYVLAGRSLREIEKRENLLYMQVLIGWLGAIVISFGLVSLGELFASRKKSSIQ